jgi:hypothetical protein
VSTPSLPICRRLGGRGDQGATFQPLSLMWAKRLPQQPVDLLIALRASFKPLNQFIPNTQPL